MQDQAGSAPHYPAARCLDETMAHYGWSRSYIYRCLAAGLLEAKKAGRRTLITSVSADRLFDSLPSTHGKAA